MTETDDRERQPPRDRFAGTERVFDLAGIARSLREESHPARNGHRQMAIFRKGSLGLLVFAFDADGRLADHVADAYVTIMTIGGELEVSTESQVHRLPAGSALVLDPGVRHEVHAPVASEMLLVIDRVED